MTSSAIALRYATALADVVTSPQSALDPQQALNQLREFDDLVKGSSDLRNSLESPAVSPARKRAVIGRLSEALGLSKIVFNFLRVLSDKRRIASLHEMVDLFDIQLDERLGFVRAEVSSPAEMDNEQKEALSEKLSHLSGKKVRMRFSVDPKLVGGVVARVGSKVYDGSVRGRLDNLSRKLLA